MKGSGPDGRILLQDLYDAQAQQPQQPGGQPAGAQPSPAGQPGKQAPRPALQEGTQPLPKLRAAIAKTVTQSWSSIPHFTVTMEILMDEAESLRHQLKQTGIPVTVNDLIVKAVALTLQDFRLLNASFGDDGIHAHGDINIGVAVGVQDGVLIPVIPGCQNLSLKEISETGRKLAEKARSGSLTEQEMSGGTFAVSNLGMYGVSDFTAVIYPTHSGVMAVGAVADTVIVRAGAPACAKVMKVTVCADHRLVDGAYVAEFLVRFKSILENPVRIIV
ncbi:2-oxo acid dehydrogenase subunit E2 [Geomonas sp. Red32]|uniref:dihydrolipoamide acetyltransferase family protein n=1 Tax=Geomonas sp. Red32 TaxID=2912856 RepID=UPI00202D00CE|nr:2-oxo acid dehydrogenase subunit E2 [Geomonas sp. Red32]